MANVGSYGMVANLPVAFGLGFYKTQPDVGDYQHHYSHAKDRAFHKVESVNGPILLEDSTLIHLGERLSPFSIELLKLDTSIFNPLNVDIQNLAVTGGSIVLKFVPTDLYFFPSNYGACLYVQVNPGQGITVYDPSMWFSVSYQGINSHTLFKSPIEAPFLDAVVFNKFNHLDKDDKRVENHHAIPNPYTGLPICRFNARTTIRLNIPFMPFLPNINASDFFNVNTNLNSRSIILKPNMIFAGNTGVAADDRNPYKNNALLGAGNLSISNAALYYDSQSHMDLAVQKQNSLSAASQISIGHVFPFISQIVSSDFNYAPNTTVEIELKSEDFAINQPYTIAFLVRGSAPLSKLERMTRCFTHGIAFGPEDAHNFVNQTTGSTMYFADQFHFFRRKHLREEETTITIANPSAIGTLSRTPYIFHLIQKGVQPPGTAHVLNMKRKMTLKFGGLSGRDNLTMLTWNLNNLDAGKLLLAVQIENTRAIHDVRQYVMDPIPFNITLANLQKAINDNPLLSEYGIKTTLELGSGAVPFTGANTSISCTFHHNNEFMNCKLVVLHSSMSQLGTDAVFTTNTNTYLPGLINGAYHITFLSFQMMTAANMVERRANMIRTQSRNEFFTNYVPDISQITQ